MKLSEKIRPIIVPNIAPKYHVPMINSLQVTAPPPWTLIFWEENPFFLDLGNFYDLAPHGHQDFYFRIPSLCPHAKN